MYTDPSVFGVSEDWDHPEKQFKMLGFISRSVPPSLSNSLLPFIESPYYYCHYKGLDLSIAKSEIPVFPPSREDLYGFFHCNTESLCLWWLLFCSCLGMVCELGKEGIYFPLHTSCLHCKDGISPPQSPRSPFLFLHAYSQHLWETRIQETWTLADTAFDLNRS